MIQTKLVLQGLVTQRTQTVINDTVLLSNFKVIQQKLFGLENTKKALIEYSKGFQIQLTKMKSIQQRIARFQSRLDVLSQRNQSSLNKDKDIIDLVTSFSSQLQRAQQQIENLRDAVNKYASISIPTQFTAPATKQFQLQALKKKLKDLQQNVSKKSSLTQQSQPAPKIQRVVQKVHTIVQQRQVISQIPIEISQKLKSLSISVQFANSFNTEQKIRIASLQNSIAELQKKNAILQQNFIQLQRNLNKQRQAIQSLQKPDIKKQQIQDREKSMNQQINALFNQINHFKKLIALQNKKIESMDQFERSLRNIQRSVQDSIRQVSMQLNQQLQKDLQVIKDKIKIMNGEILQINNIDKFKQMIEQAFRKQQLDRKQAINNLDLDLRLILKDLKQQFAAQMTKNITNIANKLNRKAEIQDLQSQRKTYFGTLGEVVQKLNQKFSLKTQTKKALLFLQQRIQEIFILLDSKFQEEQMLARRKGGLLSCISCRTQLKTLKSQRIHEQSLENTEKRTKKYSLRKLNKQQ